VTSDRQILERWVAGDQTAGQTLVQRHYAAMFRFFRAKAPADVEDLVQQTFLALVSGAAGFRGDASFRSFLFGTARNVLLHHWRRRHRKEDPIDFGTQSVVDLGASPSELLADKAEQRLLLEALRRIPVDDQIVIELYHWEDLTGPEIAQALGISEPAVRSRLHRAKARLTKRMAAIARSATVLQSTLTNLEGWARDVRDRLDPAEA
jgi:RNA polymerase sigma factor (sigma-70 family)